MISMPNDELPMWFECTECKMFAKFSPAWTYSITRLLNGEIPEISVIHSRCSTVIIVTADKMCWKDGGSYKTEW